MHNILISLKKFFVVRLFTNDEDIAVTGSNFKYATPTKHELISCLGVSGRWITSQANLQVNYSVLKDNIYNNSTILCISILKFIYFTENI